MSPMHHSRNNQPIDIGQDFFERLSFFRPARWQLGEKRARFYVGRDAYLPDLFPIIRNPIGELMQLPAEFLRQDVAEFIGRMRWSIFHYEGRR
jgi:hypothetical protein